MDNGVDLVLANGVLLDPNYRMTIPVDDEQFFYFRLVLKGQELPCWPSDGVHIFIDPVGPCTTSSFKHEMHPDPEEEGYWRVSILLSEIITKPEDRGKFADTMDEYVPKVEALLARGWVWWPEHEEKFQRWREVWELRAIMEAEADEAR